MNLKVKLNTHNIVYLSTTVTYHLPGIYGIEDASV